MCTRSALYWCSFLHAFCFSLTRGTTPRHPLGRGYCPATPPRTFRHASLDSASIAPLLRPGSVCAVLAGPQYKQHELLMFVSTSEWHACPVQCMDPRCALDALPRTAAALDVSPVHTGSTTRMSRGEVIEWGQAHVALRTLSSALTMSELGRPRRTSALGNLRANEIRKRMDEGRAGTRTAAPLWLRRPQVGTPGSGTGRGGQDEGRRRAKAGRDRATAPQGRGTTPRVVKLRAA
jgi:hypothetical protein